ncbi:unannotated protein [freshwater metagenome]|uniref:Unannotated protein n=1 Tax=freshwater metagenome TaxID=449393 RepID=A0A6J7HH53_9ZZZZ
MTCTLARIAFPNTRRAELAKTPERGSGKRGTSSAAN